MAKNDLKFQLLGPLPPQFWDEECGPPFLFCPADIENRQSALTFFSSHLRANVNYALALCQAPNLSAWDLSSWLSNEREVIEQKQQLHDAGLAVPALCLTTAVRGWGRGGGKGSAHPWGWLKTTLEPFPSSLWARIQVFVLGWQALQLLSHLTRPSFCF